MTSELPTTPTEWTALLERETELLRALAQATVDARSASLRDPTEGLMSHLETQSALCRELEASRARRRQALRRAGRSLDELPVVVADSPDEAIRARAETALNQWIEAAQATQRENDLNREFYSVALAAVEEAVSIITGSETRTYDLRGRSVAGEGRKFVATSI